MTSTQTVSAKAAALEGLDFIETEEDVKAVEAATLKIQSTFRGKKFRSKQAAPAKSEPEKSTATDSSSPTTATTTTTTKTKTVEKCSDADADRKREESKSELELSRKVAAMQVQDNNNQMEADASHVKGANAGASGEEEAERAATKIQAGFKGYKTRKELEGKLPAGSAGGAADDAKGGS